MLRIGMTGGIGSGKSTIGSLFEALDAPVVDTDDIARNIREPGQQGYVSIVDYFGKECLLADGSLNREWLRKRIFSSNSDKKALETMTHPLIFDALDLWFEKQSSRYCIAIVPLLYETNSMALFNRILVIDCPRTLQIKRMMKRDNLSNIEANRIISHQASPENRRKIADNIIINKHETTSTLVKEVKKLHNLYLSISQTKG